MSRFFRYEWKKNGGILIILTVIAVAVYVVTLSFTELYDFTVNRAVINRDPQLGIAYAELAILCAAVPVIMYSFKMNKRSVDTFYSLPIKKEKLYLVKTLVGLILVLVPYTFSYWLGFASICLRENYYFLQAYVPGYFLSLLFAVCLYGLNAFVFTRANRIVDGIIFILFYTFIGAILLNFLSGVFPDAPLDKYTPDFFSFGGLMELCINSSSMIRVGQKISELEWNLPMFLYPVLLGAVSYFLMFFLLRYEKGENAEQNSESWFGYKTMIPIYMALLLALLSESLINTCLIVIGGFVLTIVYTRKVLFHWPQWLVLALSVGAGIGLYFLVEYIEYISALHGSFFASARFVFR